ncbi:MAG: MFS transporter [Clostridiales bacterium]|nr:MFS transporter [Clostridiales bacterium]
MKDKLFTKNFTLLILGQVSSLFGNFILKFALSMYVLEVTGSATTFASTLAFATIPTILLSPLGGILADRANRKYIMVALDTLSGISVLLAILFFTHNSSIIIITILLVALSILGAFESPTVQACVPQMLIGDNIIKGNAVVNQVGAIAALIAPILGSLFYTALGIKPVMYIAVLCFFLTAGFECFIKLNHVKPETNKHITTIIKEDFLTSVRFICKEQPTIFKMLLLTTIITFFAAGAALVGLPFIVRKILKMSAKMYGIAESLLGFSAILGSIAAGLLIGKLKMKKLFLLIITVGIFFSLSGIVFLLPVGGFTKFTLNLISFCGFQIAVCIFSIFALSYIQQKTPNNLMGKIMSYVVTFSMCSQPLSQMIFGVLFDKFRNSAYLVLVPTGIIIFIIGLLSINFFEKINADEEEVSE